METCKLCGNLINLEDFIPHLEIPQLMAKEHVCFSCGFWIDRKKADDALTGDKVAIITPDWGHWIVTLNRGLFINIGTFEKVKLEATRFYMVTILQNKVYFIDNNNIAHQGIIPRHLRTFYTPNGIYLSKEEIELFQARVNLTTAEIENLIKRRTI